MPGVGVVLPGAQQAAQREAERMRREQEDRARAERDRQFQEQQQRQQQAAAQQQNQAYQAGQPSAAASTRAASTAYSQSTGSGAGYDVDPYGNVSYNDAGAQTRRTQQAAATQAASAARLQANLSAAAEARRLETLRTLMADYGGGTGAREPLSPRETHPGASVSGNEEAARAAIFARTKDTAGDLAGAQLRGLQSAMAGRGLSGSPIEMQRMSDVLGGAKNTLEDLNAAQMQSDLDRQAQVSDMRYQGGIQQRGQDINRPFPVNPQLQALISLMGAIY